ncbi:MAG TPA: 16S rRNA (guanine(966)-N(2))-methyltransferase RsmD, partial [Terriglobia bacterium]|nr:16S rRNA (guanine(966)-N(2))-methyltransferase RsmD [Terriglobia bacterium]
KMRIISGMYRGHFLKTLKGGKLRPTSDHLRETLFDVLGPLVEGATFLDAYAGSGAVGLEALSRGARQVVFLEHHRPAAQLIRENLAGLEIESGYEVLPLTVEKGLAKLTEEGAKFDFAFIDPPYEEIREYHHALRELARSGLLAADAIVVAEHSRFCELEDRYGSLARTRLLKRGDSQLSFYRLESQAG